MKVLVAMSGGVDSSLAAALVVEQGHEVAGVTLKLWGGDNSSGCCSLRDVEDARRVAQVLGIPHHVFAYTEEFEEHVVTPFVTGHTKGQSPNPCIECNRHLKFGLLFERAKRLGFDAVATGHHAQVRERNGKRDLVRGADPLKDQSYVLGYLTDEQLNYLMLPIGHLTKDVVREMASERGLRTADKPDSLDVCFVDPTVGREGFLASRVTLTTGRFVERGTGVDLGPTGALEVLTVGQRRGVPVGRAGAKRFVTKLDVAAGIVEVSGEDHLGETEIALDPASLTVVHQPLRDGQDVMVQTSAHGTPLRATFEQESCRVRLAAPARPVAAGQSVVFYDSADPTCVVAAATVVR